MMRQFGWTWVGLVVNDDEDGQLLARTYRSQLQSSGVACLAYVEFVDVFFPTWSTTAFVISASTARVVIYMAAGLGNVVDKVRSNAHFGIRNHEMNTGRFAALALRRINLFLIF